MKKAAIDPDFGAFNRYIQKHPDQIWQWANTLVAYEAEAGTRNTLSALQDLGSGLSEEAKETP